MRKSRKSATFFIFVGFLLVVVFAVGYLSARNPEAFRSRYMEDYALDSFLNFCAGLWPAAGVIGIPMLLISLILSLISEARENRKR